MPLCHLNRDLFNCSDDIVHSISIPTLYVAFNSISVVPSYYSACSAPRLVSPVKNPSRLTPISVHPPTCKSAMRNVALFTIRLRDRLRWLCSTPRGHLGLQAVRSVGPHTAFLGTESYAQCRGVKTKATYQLSELPIRSLEYTGSLSEFEDAGPVYPTVVLQARNNMQKYESCVLLTRVGSFYEVLSYLSKERT